MHSRPDGPPARESAELLSLPSTFVRGPGPPWSVPGGIAVASTHPPIPAGDPTLIAVSTSHDANAWAALLERLSASRAALVEDFLDRLASARLYDGYDVTPEDLRQAATDTMSMLILQMGGVPLPPHLKHLPARLGARRARQGVGRDALIEAVRLDFRVLWSGLVRANSDGPSDLLVLHTEELLSAVERYISDVQVAYLDEQAALNRDSRVEITRAFSRLLAAGENAGTVADDVAEALKLRADAEFEVVCVSVSNAERARRAVAAANKAGRQFISWDFDDGTAFVRERQPGAGWAATFRRMPGGLVESTRGLANVPNAIALARTVARHAGDAGPGLSTDADVWPCIAHERLSPILPTMRGPAVAAVEELPEQDRDLLLDTVLQFCTNGSIKETANVLFCHRNTIVNRLQRFRDLTGLDVTIPVDSARALIAIGARLPRRP